jgi:uncharacterized SAM-binding protein YcdF (DUF218 family)
MSETSGKNRKRRRSWILLLFLIIGLFLMREPVLTGLASFLVVEDELRPADLVFLLNGCIDTRPFFAGTLFKEGLAPKIAIAREKESRAVGLGLLPNITEISVGVLMKIGVPESQIEILPGEVTSTREEADALRQYVEKKGIDRVIVVTSSFHTRRAKWIIEKTLAERGLALQMAAVEDPEYDENNWWKREEGFFRLFEEYVKLVYYFLAY